ncbi:MAG: hypothetical protein HY689_08345 [Chloroflexi bacterium]|nr:hypothetical protein [Chloroflexota bacterium]
MRSPQPHPTGCPALSPRSCLRAWRRAAGPWAPYVWPTPLTAPRPAGAPRDDAAETLAAAWVEELHAALSRDTGPAGGAWRARAALAIADLPALVALASAPCLLRHGIRPVAVLRRWPSPNGLLPAGPLVDVYARYAGQLRLRGRPRGAVFLVESERRLALPPARWEPPAPLRTHLDNRYTLDTQDLPVPARLHAGGITTVLAVTPPEPALPAPDLADYYRSLAAHGITVAMLPLEALAGVVTHPEAPEAPAP